MGKGLGVGVGDLSEHPREDAPEGVAVSGVAADGPGPEGAEEPGRGSLARWRWCDRRRLRSPR
eukprot:15114577-Alexandrium_andersonii.AAC.1